MEKSGRMEFGIASSRIAMLGGFSVKNFGDIKAGGNLGMESPSGYDEIDGDFKAVMRLSSKQLLTFALQNVVQTEVPRFDQVAQRGYKYYSFDPQIRRLAYAKFQSFSKSNWLRSLNLTLSWHQSIEQRKKQKNETQIRIVEKVLGSSIKKPVKREEEIKLIVRKSIVAKENISKDSIIQKNMLAYKRPGTGLPQKHLEEIIGKKAKVDIKKDEIIIWDMIY